MVITKDQYDMLISGNQNVASRGISLVAAQKWNIEVPNEPGKVGVPYIIDRVFFGREKVIRTAMGEIEANSCIR